MNKKIVLGVIRNCHRHKYIKQVIALISLVSLVTACVTDEFDMSSKEGEMRDGVVKINASIYTSSKSTRMNSSEAGDRFEAGDTIAVCRGNDIGYLYYYDRSTNSSHMEPAQNRRLRWNNNTENVFYAYFPHDSLRLSTSYTNFILPENQSDSIDKADYMRALPFTCYYNETASDKIDLSFRHQLSRVRVKITSGGGSIETLKSLFTGAQIFNPTDVEGTDVVSKYPGYKATEIDNSAYQLKDTINYKDSVWANLNTALFTTDQYCFDAIVVPGKYAVEDTFINIKVESSGRTSFRAAKVNSSCNTLINVGLKAGYAYDITVKIKDTSLVILSCHIADWESGETELGVAELYTKQPFKAIDLGLPSGTKWADRNLNADSIYDYGTYYAWGDTIARDYYDETSTYPYYNDAGYVEPGVDGVNGKVYFYLIGDTITKTQCSISYTKYDMANKLWRSGWHLPTPDELRELVMYCSVTEVTIKGVKGAKFTGPNQNWIFIPYAGANMYGSIVADSEDTESQVFCWSGLSGPMYTYGTEWKSNDFLGFGGGTAYILTGAASTINKKDMMDNVVKIAEVFFGLPIRACSK